MFIYSLFNQLVGFQSLSFKRQDLLNTFVDLLIWLQFYDRQCHEMEGNNNIFALVIYFLQGWAIVEFFSDMKSRYRSCRFY